MESIVRVRFAPSPTGPVHAGNIRTAIFNWLFAKKLSGQSVLRIEDTDPERSRKEYAENILNTLEWLGLDWDEGPVFQSQRTEIYNEVIGLLYEKGAVYPCFCSEAQLAADRKEAERKHRPPVYAGRCRLMDRDEARERREAGPHAMRFAFESEKLEYHDAVRGRVAVDIGLMGDFIVRRSSGTVTYNLAAAVDDAKMGITHVIRGEDHISNSPKQIMIMKALGYSPPVYAHLPLIHLSGGRKLSKRDPFASIDDLRKAGFLPSAVVNFLALIGWSPADRREEMDIGELIEKFSLERVSLRSATYDLGKLRWLNKTKIKREELRSLLAMSKPFAGRYRSHLENLPEERQLVLISIIRDNLGTLADVEDEMKPFFEFGSEELSGMSEYPAKDVAEAFSALCEKEDFKAVCREVSAKTGAKGKNLYMPIRAGLTGRLHGPELGKIYSWFAPEERKARIKTFMEHI